MNINLQSLLIKLWHMLRTRAASCHLEGKLNYYYHCCFLMLQSLSLIFFLSHINKDIFNAAENPHRKGPMLYFKERSLENSILRTPVQKVQQTLWLNEETVRKYQKIGKTECEHKIQNIHLKKRKKKKEWCGHTWAVIKVQRWISFKVCRMGLFLLYITSFLKHVSKIWQMSRFYFHYWERRGGCFL